MPARDFAAKIIPWEGLPAWREAVRAAKQTLVATNGCFDLLHRGHVNYLQAARKLGDVLLVGLNSDASVRQIKGPERPVNSEEDRAAVLAALESVDAVCIFPDPTALGFLAVARPEVYVKGGDYTLDTINQEERRLIERAGGRVVVIGGVPGRSTTALLERMKKGKS
ncbi:MAG TPA: D-glycero-beta-D-manno-heptose 1-phosphate adenylyltransferase [Methylomirabilota bacterium]|nr:D-glycero-beta-D-manno-heptose 1-phosphate adenylyltransferase [Methylomirabilota bacterium]